jgi:mediator of RNA polymerase II transcription subunit 13
MLILCLVSASGSVTSKELVKNLSAEPVNPAANSQGAQRRQNGPNPARRADGHGSSAAIYASFISAVTGALSLQLVRCNNAIPLGSRTLFTVVAEEYYDNPRIDNDDPAAVPSLTTLQIQLTSVGKLTVSLQTISQPGIVRLCGPYDTSVGVHNAHPGCDLWLSPSGSIARLVAYHSDLHNAPSPSIPYVGGHTMASPASTSNLNQWKALVIEWLGNYGLPVVSSEEEPWVEVEVWEPFYSRLAGETWRQNEEGASVLPLKRILWPARYCFTRKKPTSLDPSLGIDDTFPVVDEPLAFAEKWFGVGQLEHEETDSKPVSRPEPETKDQETPLSRSDLPEGVESLSRAAEYPDLQASSLVYPTPPDGAFPVGPNAPAASDAAAEDLDSRHLPNSTLTKVRTKENASARERSDHDMRMSFGPSPGFIVGSGLYDTNDDDDLFGEMNQRDFGSKGITDADFSFFDDPEFNHLSGNVNEMDVDAQKTPELAIETDEPKPQPFTLEQPLSDNLPRQRDISEHADTTLAHPEEKISNVPPADVPLSASMHISSPINEDNQTISPPLSPIEVKKTLFPGPSEGSQSSVKKGHLQGHYNPVAFKQNILDWDQKYGAEGKFRFTGAVVNNHTAPTSTTGDIPTIGLPRRNTRNKNPHGTARNTDRPRSPASDLDQPIPSDSDFDSTSDTSDESDENLSNSDASVTTFLTRKRKRARSHSGSSVNVPQEKPLARSEQSIATSRTDDQVFLGNFLSTFSDWSMTGYFSAAQKQLSPVLIRKDVQIQVAQLLVDQVTQSCLDHKVDGILGISDFESKAYSLRTFLEDTAFMGEIERLDLNGFVSLQENGGLSPPSTTTMSRQSSQRKENGKSSMSKLAAPHLRVRRGKDYLEVLPPAVSFWETFGLEPAYGSKDISAYCIHPQVATEAANDFLERLGLLYSSCNLGQHTRASKSTGFDRGMCPWNIGAPGELSYHGIMQSLKSICDKLGM